uniref:Uncharacterized protein n=1 Tax=Sphaeramia orbicularis TaxID=375764 RepID=A0A673CKA1_9TELE
VAPCVKSLKRAYCSASGELSPGFTGPTGEGREPDSPSQIGVKATLLSDSLSRFQMRSIFRGRRRSSGYFSYESDSLPDSPPSPRPMTADKATQTPSLTAQVMIHALERTAEAHGEGAFLTHDVWLSVSVEYTLGEYAEELVRVLLRTRRQHSEGNKLHSCKL